MSNIIFQTLKTDGSQKRLESNLMTVDFAGIRLGTDNLAIAQAGSGAGAYFDFGSRALRTSFIPVNNFDLVNKAYVDAISQSLLIKDAVRAATVAALPAVTAAGSQAGKTLTADADGALVIDDVTIALNERVLIKNQVNAVDNGVYVATDIGSVSSPFVLTRAIDFDGTPTYEVRDGSFTFVQEGTTNANAGYVLVTNGAITVDTTSMEFTQFSGAGQIIAGEALEKIGNALNVKFDGVTIGLNGSNELEVKDLSIGTGKITDASINEDKLATSVAGNGLNGGAGAALEVGAGDAIKVGANNVAVDFSLAKTNDNASPVALNKVVYVKPNGNIDLATKALATFNTELGIVEDASIPAASSGKVVFRRGAKVSGFTGLIPGAEYMIDTAGDIALYSAITFAVGEYVHVVGKALSDTELLFNPYFKYEY